MKKIIYSIMAVAVLMFTSCDDFTDLQPKGKNLLTTTDQLELLLNNESLGCGRDMRVMAGDMIYTGSNVANVLSQPTKTRDAIIWTYDEASMDKMAELTASDEDYTLFYSFIGTVANPILSKIDEATGDESTKKQIKCEALALRAWSFYWLVNKFAGAYDPATAASTPGIILMTEDKDIQTPQVKSTVAEVYAQILKDINAAIDLGGLPDVAVNKMRFNKAAAYAVKAQVLLNMQQWDEAEQAAQQALAINGIVNDYNHAYQGTMQGAILQGQYPVIQRGEQATDEDYFFFLNQRLELMCSYTPETMANFEEGHAYKDKMCTMGMMYDYMMDASQTLIGEAGFTVSYDMFSYWNDGGLRSPQMYLAIAECETHKGNYDVAMENLDKVRINRIDPAKYQPLKGTVSTLEDAIAHVKQVTMNEDLYSINIFVDKKRWNQLDGWKQNYSRTLAGKTYTITPESKMWIFPFPQDVLNNNNQMTQNYKE